jgi:hypothetical protein
VQVLASPVATAWCRLGPVIAVAAETIGLIAAVGFDQWNKRYGGCKEGEKDAHVWIIGYSESDRAD